MESRSGFPFQTAPILAHVAQQHREGPAAPFSANDPPFAQQSLRFVVWSTPHANSALASKKPQTVHPRTVTSEYLLSGLLYCSCGHAMIGRGAKSGRYHYYECNGNFKQGHETCSAKSIPQGKLERAVLDQIRNRVLNDEWLEELVKLVNIELDSDYQKRTEKIETIDLELGELRLRLSKLYEALETGKLF